MPLHFEVTLRVDDRPDQLVSGDFTDAELKKLRLFLEQYEALAASKPGREGIACSVSLKWEEGGALVVKSELPDADTLGLLLHRLRPFVLVREPASFAAVSSLVGKRVTNPYLRQLISTQRKEFEGGTSEQPLTIASNDVIVNSDRTLRTWLNSSEYHRDLDKAQQHEELLQGTPNGLVSALLTGMLVDKVRAIRNLAILVKVLTAQGETMRFETAEISRTSAEGQAPSGL